MNRAPSTPLAGTRRALFLLRIGAFCCFLGWSWQHLYWDAPYREILWDPDHVGWILSFFGIAWGDYVGHVQTDPTIIGFIRIVGVLYLVLAGLCLSVQQSRPRAMVGLLVGSGMLLLLAYCKYLDHLRYWAQLIEYGAQVASPLVLVLALRLGVHHPLTLRVALVAVVLTFAGHGLYAIGYFPTPANFTTMVMTLLNVDEGGAARVLEVAGILDLAVCVGVFVPHVRAVLLGYAVLWGFLTALARPAAGMRFTYEWWGADQYLHEFLYRVPHFVLPLVLLLAFWPSMHRADSKPATDKEAPDGVQL